MPSRQGLPPVTDQWTLKRFDEYFDRWVSIEDPSDDLRIIVLDWIMTRHENPHRGVKRQVEIDDNLWYGRIPDSGDGHGNVVVCSYRIEVLTSTLTCDSIATLPYPA